MKHGIEGRGNKMSDWRCCGELWDTINYEKGDEGLKLIANFDKRAKNITISQRRWESNGNPVLVSQDNPIRYSSKYGYFQHEYATLGLDDVKWIAGKAEELFKEEEMANE